MAPPLLKEKLPRLPWPRVANHKSPTVGPHGAPGYKGTRQEHTRANEHQASKKKNPTSRMPVLLSMHLKNEYLRFIVCDPFADMVGASVVSTSGAHRCVSRPQVGPFAVMTFNRLLEGPSKQTCKRAHKHQTSKKWELYVEGADDMISYKVHHLPHLIDKPPCHSTANAHTSTKPNSALHYARTTHIPLRHGP